MIKKSNKKILVIGGGPAGLTAAYLLSKQGIPVTLLEANTEYVGGISRTVDYNGFLFDIGGHRFFSKSQRVEDLWTEILGSDMLIRPRSSRIYYRGRFFSYPLKATEAFLRLGVLESILCVLSYVQAKLLPAKNPINFQDGTYNAMIAVTLMPGPGLTCTPTPTNRSFQTLCNQLNPPLSFTVTSPTTSMAVASHQDLSVSLGGPSHGFNFTPNGHFNPPINARNACSSPNPVPNSQGGLTVCQVNGSSCPPNMQPVTYNSYQLTTTDPVPTTRGCDVCILSQFSSGCGVFLDPKAGRNVSCDESYTDQVVDAVPQTVTSRSHPWGVFQDDTIVVNHFSGCGCNLQFGPLAGTTTVKSNITQIGCY